MTQSAITATNEFHHHLEAAEFEKILADATPEFKKRTTVERSTASFDQIRTKLGKPNISQPTNIQIKHMPAGKIIVIQFQTRFEKGNAQETFTWRIEASMPRLISYSVSSPLLNN
jgi:hypothetical protein